MFSSGRGAHSSGFPVGEFLIVIGGFLFLLVAPFVILLWATQK